MWVNPYQELGTTSLLFIEMEVERLNSGASYNTIDIFDEYVEVPIETETANSMPLPIEPASSMPVPTEPASSAHYAAARTNCSAAASSSAASRSVCWEETPKCHHCAAEVDTAEHTLEVCPSRAESRRTLVAEVGDDLSLPSVIDAMLGSEEAWDAEASFCEDVMSQKEAAERMRENDLLAAPLRRLRRGGRRRTQRPAPSAPGDDQGATGVTACITRIAPCATAIIRTPPHWGRHEGPAVRRAIAGGGIS
ncbi:hypothetical protein B5X24_HaOG210226 [Helicoverpa armigera]|nr:hypothetical protein B5X24_HaOG210226 [Helicoverpa armigera]